LRQAYTGPKVKAAHYSPHTLGFGIGRLYQALMFDNNIEIEVFGNIGSCANWLGVPESALV
jgi:hypothetical protein